MRIGTVSREAGVNIQTLRYYERRGLLPKARRLESGYREYDGSTVPLVRFIKNAQELGFTLSEIEELIELRANRSRNQSEVRERAVRKIEEMERRIRHLMEMKDELAALVDKCTSASRRQDCMIINAFDDSNASCRTRNPHSTNGGRNAAQ